jgi:hypothetical protein
VLPAKPQWLTALGAVFATLGKAGGIIGLFNVISTAQGWVSLSKSMQFLVAIWRRVMNLTFDWLPFHLSDLSKDLLALFALAAGAVTFELMTTYRISLWGLPIGVFKGDKHAHAVSDLLMAKLAALNKVMFRISGAFVALLVVGVGIAIPALGLLLIVSCAIFVWGVTNGAVQRLFDRRDPEAQLMQLCMIVFWLPVMTVGMVIGIMAMFPKSVFRSAGAVLLLLVLNYVFVRYSDPIYPLIQKLAALG